MYQLPEQSDPQNDALEQPVCVYLEGILHLYPAVLCLSGTIEALHSLSPILDGNSHPIQLVQSGAGEDGKATPMKKMAQRVG